jgi:ferredoxin
MPVHVIVDSDACIGSAECVALDPDAIELDEQGVAHIRIVELDADRANDLVDACPVGALSVTQT